MEITWKEILENREDIVCPYNESLLKLLKDNDYEPAFEHDPHYIIIYNSVKKYAIANGHLHDQEFTFIDKINNVSTTKSSQRCCNNPNVIKNHAGGIEFWVCRNCKQEIQ